ncbi:MAG: hypothetical protein WBL37_05625 [Dehalococcoidales bacterium]
MEHTIEQPEVDKKENSDPLALTSIRDTYTLASTQKNADEIMKNTFLETLAEVAMSIASRKGVQPEKEAEPCEP